MPRRKPPQHQVLIRRPKGDYAGAVAHDPETAMRLARVAAASDARWDGHRLAEGERLEASARLTMRCGVVCEVALADLTSEAGARRAAMPVTCQTCKAP